MLSATATHLHWGNAANDTLLQWLAPPGNAAGAHHHAVWPTRNPFEPFLEQRQREVEGSDEHAPEAMHDNVQTTEVTCLVKSSLPRTGSLEKNDDDRFQFFGDPQQQDPYHGASEGGNREEHVTMYHKGSSGQQGMVTQPERGDRQPQIVVQAERGDGQLPMVVQPKHDDEHLRNVVQPERDDGQPRTVVQPESDDGQPRKVVQPERGDGQSRMVAQPERDDGQPRTVVQPERGDGFPYIVAGPDSPRWIARSNDGNLVLLPVNPRKVRVDNGKMVVTSTPPTPISNHANTQRGHVPPMSPNPGPLLRSCVSRHTSSGEPECGDGTHSGIAPSIRASQNESRTSMITGHHHPHTAPLVVGAAVAQQITQPSTCAAIAGTLNEETKKLLCDILVDGKLPRRSSHLPEEIKNLLPVADTGRLTSIGSKNHPHHCVPCNFWIKRLCSKGAACTFCHIAHPGTVRPKPSKDARHKRRANLKMNVSNAVEKGLLRIQHPVVRAAERV